jgi:cytochrome b561
MSPSDTPAARYTLTAIVLHWVLAVFIIGEFAWGWWMLEIPKSPPGMRADAFNLHKSIGMCVLVLMVVRLGWNISHRAPSLPAMPAWQALAVRVTHALLYVVLIVNPLAGFLGSVWSGYPIKWFGATLPALGSNSPALKDAMSTLHLATGWLLAALVTMHIGAAIYHAARGDAIMQRILPGPRRTAARSPRNAVTP